MRKYVDFLIWQVSQFDKITWVFWLTFTPAIIAMLFGEIVIGTVLVTGFLLVASGAMLTERIKSNYEKYKRIKDATEQRPF